MGNTGSTAKEIRLNKGYSQQYIAQQAITQSAYSKFEILNSGIKTDIFKHILNRLDMSYEEFVYIENGYGYEGKEEIFKAFYSLNYNNLLEMKSLLEKVNGYLAKTDDYMIRNIRIVLNAHVILRESNDFELASEPIKEVWSNLSKRDSLYLIDLYLINSILFFFPLETALHIKNFMFKSIDRYKGFHNVNNLKINVYTNLMLLFIKSKKFTEGIDMAELLIMLCKKQRVYPQLAVGYIRKGVCMNGLDLKSEGQKQIDKGLKILSAIEEVDLYKIMKNEIKRFV